MRYTLESVLRAMRAALFGVWGADLWLELARLAAFLVPALALGPIAEHLTLWG